ncbi:S8 family serine peptidase [Natronosporangium hydrolyticum]|uniref:S8 family serine peptidase n=1 Tax=Natronosporangium hydrolyticum TaxID=2811111 RepID=A0A895YPU9_9ACTN|nr:S8 family serine peptidase [Natronosporangium hydrolyticum]QSB15998.1 S8 family serine peptidase [Natronosporangium hydrolyticum]
MLRATTATVTTGAVLALVAAPSAAQESATLADSLAIPDGPVSATATEIEPSLLSATGTVTVSLELSDPSVAEAVGDRAKQEGAALDRDQQRSHGEALKEKQRELVERISDTGATEVISTQLAGNLVVVEVDAAEVTTLAADPDVVKVLPVIDHELHLSETVPHIGAGELHDLPDGVTGEGVRVAVLDTGIDYTHAAFGGEGTQEAYEAAYGTATDDPTNTERNGLFPTDKVVEGYDFVGEFWPNGELNPNPDPIDCGPSGTPPPCTGGHGTSVAGIIAGEGGVAPDALLYGYKVCSSVASSCNGVAILEAFEASLDPYGTGDIEDAVDIINLSLGALYGQIENPSSGAAANAARMGVTVVASAGNSADKPYITGSPASTPEVISVAWTEVPSAVHLELAVLEPAEIEGIYQNTNTVPWAPIVDGFDGELIYGDSEAEQLGCFVDADGNPSDSVTDHSPYEPGFFDGAVALVDRGVCAVSYKTHLAAEAGAVGVVVANNVGGAAPSFSFGPVDDFNEQETLVVGLEVGDTLRSGLATGEPVQVAVDPTEGTPLVNTINPSSSRGPSVSEVAIKPDIGAPGASVTADSGSGTGASPFGGTSGAAPMVAGSAALLLEAYPERSPLEVKAVLMNTAETEIFIQPALRPGELAEITRIGGGEVRVNRAFASQTAAWSGEDQSAGLSFGYHTVNHMTVLRKTVTVHNYSDQLRIYQVAPTFRHADDEASGAVRFTVPRTVAVPAGRSADVPVILRIDPRHLPEWVLDGGLGGDNGALLKENEFDGYLTITGGGDEITMPWHVLPHKASDVRAPAQVTMRQGSASANLVNSATSGQAGVGEAFALTGTSDPLAEDELPGEGDGFAVVDLAAVGVRGDAEVLQFGVTTHGQRAHPNAPAEFQIDIDANQDGEADFLIFNWDLGYPTLSDGRNVVWVEDLSSGALSAFFFTDANLNSANAILTVPLAAVGLAEGDQFDFSVRGVDTYFSGEVTDAIEDMTFTVGQPRYASDDTVEVPTPGVQRFTISEVDGGAEASPSQTGVLLLWRDGLIGKEASVITVR